MGGLFPLSLLRRELFAWEVNDEAERGEGTPERLVKTKVFSGLKLACGG